MAFNRIHNERNNAVWGDNRSVFYGLIAELFNRRTFFSLCVLHAVSIGDAIDMLSEQACFRPDYPTKVASLPYGGVNHRRSSPSYQTHLQGVLRFPSSAIDNSHSSKGVLRFPSSAIDNSHIGKGVLRFPSSAIENSHIGKGVLRFPSSAIDNSHIGKGVLRFPSSAIDNPNDEPRLERVRRGRRAGGTSLGGARRSCRA